MILKLKRPDSGKDGWMFIDGVNNLVSVLVEDGLQSQSLRTQSSDDETNYIRFVSDLRDFGYRLTFFSDGKRYEALTNNEAYILNDNGKTIERIN